MSFVRLFRWSLVAFALIAAGLAFAVVNIARAEYQDDYPFLRTSWLGLVVFTILLFGRILHVFRSSWTDIRFWFWLIAIAAGHLAGYVVVLTQFTDWRPAWFVLTTLVEAPLIDGFLQRRLTNRRRARG
jgi:hypothetical protein